MLLGCFPSHLGTHPLEVHCQEEQNQDASDLGPSCAVAFGASSGSVNLASPLGEALVEVVDSLVMALMVHPSVEAGAV
jgi:hypothetical protein